jgi:hypothetical protein
MPEEEVVLRAVARTVEWDDRGVRTGSGGKIDDGQSATPAAFFRCPMARSRSCFARTFLRMR